MELSMEVGLGPGHIVLGRDPALFPKKGTEPPQFSAHFYCGQTAECIKMPLDMEVGLIPGDFGLDGDPAPLPKKGRSPQFPAQVYCGQTAGRMKTPLVTEIDVGPGHIVLNGDPALRERGTAASPLFSTHVYCGHSRPSQLLLSSSYLRHIHVRPLSNGPTVR